MSKDKTPQIELNANQWTVANHKGNREIVLSDTTHTQSVRIFGCEDSVVSIKGKVNQIVIINCKKTGVLFENTISSFEATNCTSIQVQCTGVCPLVNIENTNGCQLYLSRDSLHAEIITSLTQGFNVNIPGKTEEDDMLELAVPQQFRTVINGGKLVTEPLAHVGV